MDFCGVEKCFQGVFFCVLKKEREREKIFVGLEKGEEEMERKSKEKEKARKTKRRATQKKGEKVRKTHIFLAFLLCLLSCSVALLLLLSPCSLLAAAGPCLCWPLDPAAAVPCSLLLLLLLLLSCRLNKLGFARSFASLTRINPDLIFVLVIGFFFFFFFFPPFW